MFIGHFGLGFGAKAASPRTSLGTLLLGAQFIDLLWPTLLLIGIEQVRIEPGATRVTPLDFAHYPVSHSLAAVLGWALAVALVYLFAWGNRRGAMVVGLLVVSHWALDALVHRPDLPLFPGSDTLIGLNLWSSLPLTLAIEVPLFALGVWLYARATRARDATGKWALWSLVAFLLASYAANLFGPPPPNVTAIAWAGHLQWLLVIWGYWIDRHRIPA
jgi:hypothetical protein